MSGCQKVRFERLIGEKKVQSIARSAVALPQPGLNPEIVSLDRTVRLTAIDVAENRVMLSGCLTVYVSCLMHRSGKPVEHIIRDLEFAQMAEIPGAAAGMKADCTAEVVDLFGTVEGDDLEITAVVETRVRVTDDRPVNLMLRAPVGVAAVTGLLRLEELLGEGESRSFISGGIKLSDREPGIGQILEIEARALVLQSVSCEQLVTCRGEVVLQVWYLPAASHLPVRVAKGSFPFTGKVAVPEARAGLRAGVAAQVQDCSYTCTSPREVALQASLRIEAAVYAWRELTVVTDLENQAAERDRLRLEHPAGEGRGRACISEEVAAAGTQVVRVLDTRALKVYLPDEDLVIIKGRVVLSGTLYVRVLYLAGKRPQRLLQEEYPLRFRCLLKVPGARPEQRACVRLVGERVSARPGAGGGGLVLQAALRFLAQVVEVRQVSLVPCLAELPGGGTASLEHVIQPGDTFWNLAVKYQVSLDRIMRANPDLDPNNLRIGTPVLIPCDP